MSERQKNTLILIFILLAGTILRFFKFSEIPFTHDEFSALFRLKFNNFSELIEQGVMVDGHPAGIHVFLYYWTKIFGFSEIMVKLPFLVSGVLSIWLIYNIGKKWFNPTVGLNAAAFMASLQYTVMNSQIARPYISGMFFSLLMVYFWSGMIFKPQLKFNRNAAGFIIASAICAYNHHFSLLFAFIVGITGLFLLEKKFIPKYIFCGITIFLLYLPHINIFFHQLTIGGIGNWLAKPSFDFLPAYLYYIFHFSFFTISLVILISAWGLYKFDKQKLNKKLLLVSFSWFILPFLAGFIYSLFVDSVLQVNVLIFSFPFLFFILFGHIPSQKPRVNFFLVTSILLINTLTLILERQHYKLFYQSPYMGILQDFQDVNSANSSFVAIIDSHPEIMKFFQTRQGLDGNYFRADTCSVKSFISFLSGISEETEKLYFGALSGSNPVFVPLIMEYFPDIIWQKNYSGGTSYLFGRKRPVLENFIEEYDFETFKPPFIDSTKYLNTGGIKNNNSYLLDSLSEYSPVITKKLSSIVNHENNFIDISVKVFRPNRNTLAVLVASLHEGEKQVHWDGRGFDVFIQGDRYEKGWVTVHHSIKLSDIKYNKRKSELRVYIWNHGNENLILDNQTIRLRDGNPYIYGLFEKFF